MRDNLDNLHSNHSQLPNDCFSVLSLGIIGVLTHSLADIGVFKSTRKMEAEIVSMVKSLLHGGSESVGTLASGGTEAILLAIKTHR